MLYKFSPVCVTPLTNPVLCANLEKCMILVDHYAKTSFHGHEIKITLYSIDCVRKLLLNHHFNDAFLFEQLDEAREAETKDDQDFWRVKQQVWLIFRNSRMDKRKKNLNFRIHL